MFSVIITRPAMQTQDSISTPDKHLALWLKVMLAAAMRSGSVRVWDTRNKRFI